MTNKIKKLMLNGDEYLIREWIPRRPGANTYCYLPLVSDYADHSGNGVAVTSDLTSFGDDMFPGGTGKYVCVQQTGVVTASTPRTILFWVYPKNKNNGKVTVLSETTTWESHNFNRGYNREFGAGASGLPSTLNVCSSGYEGGAYNSWHLFVATHSANGQIYGCWDGGTLSTNGNTYGSNTNNYPVYFGRHVVYTGSSYPYGLLGQMKDIIIESKVWSQEEIATYYNQTKSLYGIS